MNFFDRNKTAEFIKSYKEELYTKTHFVQVEDPEDDDFFEEDAAYGNHISQTQEKLYAILKKEIREAQNDISETEAYELYVKLCGELSKGINTINEKYIEEITVDYQLAKSDKNLNKEID